MLKNYLTIAFRSFLKQKGFAFINILGLAIGLGAAVLIFLYIVDETSFDTIHKAPDRTYRIGAERVPDDGNTFTATGVPAVWSSQLKAEYPDVEEAAKFLWLGYPVSLAYKEADKIFLTEDLLWVEPTFPKVFYFNMVQGNAEKVFELPNAVVLTQTAANRFFGTDDPIGKTLVLKHWITNNQEVNVTVTGVIEDFPSNSHIQADYLVNYNLLASANPGFNNFLTQWGNGFFSSYIVLKEGADINKISEGLTQLLATNLGEEAREFKPFFRKITDIHFDSEVEWVNEGAGDISYIYIFGSIALLILIIACINYMNMATARSAKRSKEVGMRKSLGSRRAQLIAQFMSESLLMTFFALILSFFIVILVLPYFNDIAQKSFTIASLVNPRMLLTLAGIVVFVALVAGSYPALYLSGFNPVEVLKGSFVAGRRSEAFRKGLVVFQFCISLILIICAGIVMKQMHFLSTSKLNESGEQLLSIRYGDNAPAERYQAFKNKVLEDADIAQVTMANHLPRQDYFGGINTVFVFPDVNNQEYEWSQLNVDFDFPQTFGLELITGRDFSKENQADSSALLLNEAAVRNLGITTEEAVGMSVMNNDNNEMSRVIGVVKDFPYRSMHQTIGPLIISARPHSIDKIVYVKLPAGKVQEKIASLESQWKEVYPNLGFDYWFVSDEFSRMYASEERMAGLTQGFSVLAILIACLGLFGLASYLAEQRTKEIGIRKVLGASIVQVLFLLFSTFFIMFAIACLIAMPLAYWLMHTWLQNFVYHISIEWTIFLLSVLIVGLLTVFTVGYETIRASLANPVDAIRHE